MRPIQAFLLEKERSRVRARRRDRKKSGLRSLGLGLLALACTVVAVGGILAAFYYAELASSLPAIDELPVLLDRQNGTLLQPTELYDRTGQHLIYSLENPGIPRRNLALDSFQGEAFSPILIQTILAVQDPGYSQRSGIRWDHLADSTPETIPEKLVSDLLMGDESPGLQRSLHMRLLADQAVTRYGKSKVLEWYLNSAFFGHLAYGADSAAWLYLDKPASQLNLAESALLAGVLETPALNPLDAPAAALENQQKVLQYLLGSGVIGADEYQEALNTSLDLRQSLDGSQSPAPAFSSLALSQLSAQIDRTRLERGGLRIITSLDYDLQEQVTCTLQTQLARLGGSSAPANLCPAANLLPSLPISTPQNLAGLPLAASGVILDPQNGQVLALSGDITLEGESGGLRDHPAGSLQTPFLALAGFARGLSPATLVWDIPSDLPGYQNPDGQYHGPQRLRTALANDYLVPLSQTLLQVGSDTLAATAQTVGLSGFALPQDPRDTFFSGQPLSPLSVAHAYSVFATLGQLNGQPSQSSSGVDPVLVQRVEDPDGQVLYSNQTVESRPVVSQQLAYLVHDVLADEAARWPSLGYPNPLEIGRPAGAKTGWADDGQSTWAAGYTRQSLAVVWLGYEDEDPAYPDLGTLPAAGLWHALIQYTSRSQPVLSWDQPAGISQVQVCDPSGLLPTAECPNVVSEVFLNGNEPTAADNLYQSFQINRETGRLATVFTPPELVEEHTYLVVPPEAEEWSQLAGLPTPPSDYDAIQAPAPDPQVNFSAPQQFSFVRGQVTLRGTADGSDFASYSLQAGQGINPTAWITIGESSTRPVEDGTLGAWDTGGLDGLYVLRLQVVHSDQRVEYALLQVTVDNTPPQVSLAYPQDGQVFSDPGQRSITLGVEVSDNIGVQRVEWWLDGAKLGERDSAPYALVYQATPGQHTLQVRAYDQAGNEGESGEVKFEVR